MCARAHVRERLTQFGGKADEAEGLFHGAQTGAGLVERQGVGLFAAAAAGARAIRDRPAQFPFGAGVVWRFGMCGAVFHRAHYRRVLADGDKIGGLFCEGIEVTCRTLSR